MPVEYELEGDDTVVFIITGELNFEEFLSAQQKTEAVIQRLGHVKILILTENFKGWKQSEGWGDWSFADKNDPFIKKIAIVADEKWKDLITLFTGKDLRSVPIELYEPSNEPQARQWLGKES